MTDKMAGNIPTLEDVVEVGAATEQDDIRIVADNDDGMEDVYDEEFKKLFEPAQDNPVTDLAEVEDHASDEAIRDEPAMQMVEDQPPLQDVAEPVAEAETEGSLDDISISAHNEPVSLETSDGSTEDMWLQDWQEETAVVDDMDRDIEIGRLAESAEQPAVVAAAIRDQMKPESAAVANADAPTTAEDSASEAVAAMSGAINDDDDLSDLVNDIVSEIMPEIEWKLRTRIRDILEQRFLDSD